MSSLENFKQTVIDTIPIQRHYKLYIYDSLGEILFREQWNFIKLYKGETKVWKGLQGWLQLIKSLYPNKTEELINYIFTEVSNQLTDYV